MAFLSPISKITLPISLNPSGIKAKLDHDLLEESIFPLRITRASSKKVKGKWKGNFLLAVRPIENFWMAGNLVVLRLGSKDKPGVAWTIGNLFVSLLFVVVLIQWSFLLWRLGAAIDGAERTSILGLAHPVNSPIFHALASTIFYIMLYMNLVRKGLIFWKNYLTSIVTP